MLDKTNDRKSHGAWWSDNCDLPFTSCMLCRTMQSQPTSGACLCPDSYVLHRGIVPCVLHPGLVYGLMSPPWPCVKTVLCPSLWPCVQAVLCLSPWLCVKTVLCSSSWPRFQTVLALLGVSFYPDTGNVAADTTGVGVSSDGTVTKHLTIETDWWRRSPRHYLMSRIGQ